MSSYVKRRNCCFLKKSKKYLESIRQNAFEMLDMIENLTIKGEICKFTIGDLDRLHGARCAIKNVILGWENFADTRLGKEIKVKHKTISNEDITSRVDHSTNYKLTIHGTTSGSPGSISFDAGKNYRITTSNDVVLNNFPSTGAIPPILVADNIINLSDYDNFKLQEEDPATPGTWTIISYVSSDVTLDIEVTINSIDVHCPYTNVQVKFGTTPLALDANGKYIVNIPSVSNFSLVPIITADVDSPKLGFEACLYMVGFRLQAEAVPMYSLSDILYNPFCNGKYSEFISEYEDSPDVLCEDITEFLEAIDRLEDLIKCLSVNNDSSSLDPDVGGICNVSCPPVNTGLGGSYKKNCSNDSSCNCDNSSKK